MNTDWADTLSGAGTWAVTAVRILAIALSAWIATSVLQGLIRRLRERIAQRMDDPEAVIAHVKQRYERPLMEIFE